MSAPNANWSKWIFSSLAKWFKDNTVGLTYFVEGEDRDTQKAQTYIEFRCNGPMMRELNKDWWKLVVEINIFIAVKFTDNIYDIHKVCGTVAAAFNNGIPILKYGDDDSFLGCMILDQQAGDNVVVTQLGQLNPDLLEMQATVEGYYCMYLDGD